MWWVADRLYGDQLFVILKPKLPEWVIAPTPAAIITYGPPILLIVLGAYFLRTIYQSSRHQQPQSQPARSRDPNALRIVVGKGGNYETNKSYNENSVTRNLLVGIKNTDPHHFISNCELYVEIPEGTVRKSYLLEKGFTLNPGEEKFISVVYNHEYVKPTERTVYRIQFSVPIVGGYYSVTQPWLPIGTHFIILRATATETKPCEVVCKVWVDDRGKLCLERV